MIQKYDNMKYDFFPPYLNKQFSDENMNIV